MQLSAVSILPIFSKVLEKIVYGQLVTFIQSNNILHPLQFGFRPQYSTETANCFFVEQLKSAIDSGEIVGAVFLDLKKAFDTLNHEILIHKLSNFNFRPLTLQWFKSYLEQRDQCVVVNNEMSTFLKMNTGVPQGSILGPLLFTLYINDLPDSCPTAGFQMYADDAVVYVRGRSVQSFSDELTKHLQNVAVWSQNAGLTLNVKKTMSICFASRFKSIPDELNLWINGQKIQQVSEVKYLGLILDSQLKFDSHIKKICRVAKANLYTFRLIRDCLPFHAAHTFMHAMIFSHISYCICTWSQATVTTIKPVQMIYNRAVKILDKKPIRSHHCISLRKLNILSFANFIKFSLLKLMHKCLNHQAPQVLSDCIVALRVGGSRTRGAQNGNCQIPRRNTLFGQSVFSVQGTKVWNCLTTELKGESNWVIFKHKLKDTLIRSQICDH